MKKREEILYQIWQTCLLDGRGHRGIKSKELLDKIGFDYNQIEIAYVNHEKKRNRNNSELQSWLVVGFIKEKVRKAEGKAQDKAVFASNGLIVPLKDKEGRICNFYCLDSLFGKYDYLYENTGLYPQYPTIDSQILILTESIKDAASILHSNITNPYIQVLALGKNGAITAEHKKAIEQLKNLTTIILAIPSNNNYETYIKESIAEIQPNIKIELLQIPEEQTIYDFWCYYQSKGLEQLYKEFAESLIQEEDEDKTEAIQNQLQIINEQKIQYICNAAIFEVRGHLPTDLGKMEVGLFVTNQETGIKTRHRVDLYNEKRVKYFVNEVCQKHKLNYNQIDSDVLKLTNQLDDYRDSKASSNPNSNSKKDLLKKELTPEAEKKAIQQLKQPCLLKEIDKYLEQAGIVGEEAVRTTAFVIASSYKMPRQLHAIVQGESGSGKTHLINIVADCMPSEDVKRFTRITERALQNMEEKELLNKCVIIQDLDGLGFEAQFALRELQSAGTFESSVASKDIYGNSKTITKSVHAKMSSLSATTKGEIYYDNMTRSIILGVDESEEQTQKIIKYHNLKLTGSINPVQEEKAKMELRNMIRMLKPYPVKNPFADRLNLPIESKMKRRLNNQLQEFICQVTLLNQYQRKVDQNGYLIVEKEDIQQAIELFFTPILLKSDDLDSSTRQFFEQIKEYVGFDNRETKTFNQVEIRKHLNKSKSIVNKYLNRLLDAGYINVGSGSKNKGYQYKIIEWDKIKELKDSIKAQLLKSCDH